MSVQGAGVGRFRIFGVDPGRFGVQFVTVVMSIVAVAVAGIVMCMDIHGRYARADYGHEQRGKHCFTRTFADCQRTSHSAPTVPDSYA